MFNENSKHFNSAVKYINEKNLLYVYLAQHLTEIDIPHAPGIASDRHRKG